MRCGRCFTSKMEEISNKTDKAYAKKRFKCLGCGATLCITEYCMKTLGKDQDIILEEV